MSKPNKWAAILFESFQSDDPPSTLEDCEAWIAQVTDEAAVAERERIGKVVLEYAEILERVKAAAKAEEREACALTVGSAYHIPTEGDEHEQIEADTILESVTRIRARGEK